MHGLFHGLVSLAEETSSPFPPEWQARCPATSLETSWEEQLLEQQDHLEKEMEEAKKMISGLQVSALPPSQPCVPVRAIPSSNPVGCG